MIYELLKDAIPIATFLKKREEGSILIIANKEMKIYYFNEVAKDFYKYINSENTVNDIAIKLLSIYDVKFDILMDDVINLTRDLQWKKMIYLKGKKE